MKTKTMFLIILIALIISACGGSTGSAPAIEPAVEAQPEAEVPAPAEEEPAPAEPAEAEQQPAEQAPASGGKSYTAPEGLFTLEIPKGWSREEDKSVIENTIVETFTAPDGNAFVQVVVNESGIEVSNVEKGQITLDFMKRLYGNDLRVAKDVLLDDGREKLEWWSDYYETSGTTFFDRIGNHLFFYTTYYKDAYESDYASMLEDVNDSYKN